MAKVGDLVVTNGTYTKDGKEKKRYVNIGALHTRDDGNHYVRLRRIINIGALDFEPGSDSIFANVYKDTANELDW